MPGRIIGIKYTVYCTPLLYFGMHSLIMRCPVRMVLSQKFPGIPTPALFQSYDPKRWPTWVGTMALSWKWIKASKFYPSGNFYFRSQHDKIQFRHFSAWSFFCIQILPSLLASKSRKWLEFKSWICFRHFITNCPSRNFKQSTRYHHGQGSK